MKRHWGIMLGLTVAAGLASATHDCAEGGLAVTLAEACVTGREPLGCAVRLAGGARPDLTLFGEGPSRVVVEVEPARAAEFEALMRESAISWRWVGETGGARLRVDVGGTTLVDVPLERIEQAWRNGFERHMA